MRSKIATFPRPGTWRQKRQRIGPRRLLVGRLGDAQDPELTDIEGLGDAPDNAALAGGVAAFEGDERDSRTSCAGGSGSRNGLPLLQLGFVVVCAQLAGEIESGDQALVREDGGCRLLRLMPRGSLRRPGVEPDAHASSVRAMVTEE